MAVAVTEDEGAGEIDPLSKPQGVLDERLTRDAHDGEFMRAREEIRREVQVLTAEGRLSAYVLGALPVFEFMVIKTVNPTYLTPMFHGGGLVALILAGCSILLGIASIKRLAKIEV